MVPPHFAGVLQQPASSGTWDTPFANDRENRRESHSRCPCPITGTSRRSLLGYMHGSAIGTPCVKNPFGALLTECIPRFPLSGFHQPPALCAGTETAVLLSGHRISCSIAYFSPAVKGFWREKTLFHDFRFLSDRDAPFFSKICKAVLAYPPIFLYNEEKHLFDFSKSFLGIVSTFSGFCASIRCSCKTQPLFRPNPKGAEIETFLSRQSVRRHV